MKKYIPFLFVISVALLVADNVCNLADTPLTKVILSHESKNYDATNRSCGKKADGTTKWCYTDLKPTQMTIGQIKAEFNKGSSNLNAVGRAQFIKDTFFNMVSVVGLRDDEIFSKELQDSLMERYFYKIKRPLIHSYLFAEGDIEAAALAIAKEWASVGVKKGLPLNKYKNKPQGYSQTECGDSFYRDGSAGNKAWTCYADIIEALKITKQQIQDGNCTSDNYEPQSDNNQTGSGRQETPVVTPQEYDIKNNTYFGTCNDIDFRPESNSCGYSPIASKQIGGNPYEYNTQNVDDCYCAADQNPSSGQYGVVNADIVPTEVKLNEETTQMIIDGINTLVYLREYWTRGLGIEAYGLAPQITFQPSNNMEQRKLNDTLEKKNKEKCVTLEAKINELSAQISKIEQELYQNSK